MAAEPDATYVDMTPTIVAFAEPLLTEIPPADGQQLAALFERVIEVWNIWTASSSWNDERGIDELADALARGVLSDAERYIHRVLAEHFVTRFRSDGRVVVDWCVTNEGGAPVFRCAGCSATPKLIAALKGIPN
jgi:hypothetical protein